MPRAPPPKRSETKAVSSSLRSGRVRTSSARTDSTRSPVTNSASWKAWVPMSAAVPAAPARSGASRHPTPPSGGGWRNSTWTCRTAPISPAATISRASRTIGKPAHGYVTPRRSPPSRARSTRSRASSPRVASGLSQMTWIPASRKHRAISWCDRLGVVIATASMPSGRARSASAIAAGSGWIRSGSIRHSAPFRRPTSGSRENTPATTSHAPEPRAAVAWTGPIRPHPTIPSRSARAGVSRTGSMSSSAYSFASSPRRARSSGRERGPPASAASGPPRPAQAGCARSRASLPNSAHTVIRASSARAGG